MQAASTQMNIPIAGMKDGIIILKDGQYRIVLEVAAINFELKSEQEQNAIVFQYQSFLNSLHFPIEIVVQSKKLDLSPYLRKVKDLAVKQKNELIKIQTADYVDFVEQLINLANIMQKRFYVVVGFQPLTVSNNFIDKLLKRNEPKAKLRISETDFDAYSKELRQRATTVAQGLGSMGLHCRQLNTQEVVELFYEVYNPEVAGKERLTNPEEVGGSYVTQLKSSQDKPQDESSDSYQAPARNGSLIDNKEVVSATQQVKIRQIAIENAQATDQREPEEGQEEAEEALPGEAAVSSEPTATPPEQADTENYGN